MLRRICLAHSGDAPIDDFIQLGQIDIGEALDIDAGFSRAALAQLAIMGFAFAAFSIIIAIA